jgi:hypothetical protein
LKKVQKTCMPLLPPPPPPPPLASLLLQQSDLTRNDVA